MVNNGSIDCKRKDSLGTESLMSPASARLHLLLHFDLFFMHRGGLSILKVCSYGFYLNVPSEVTSLGIPSCQTPMCGVSYSCSYVLLILSKVSCCPAIPEWSE